MSVQQKLDQVDALKKKIDALGKLPEDVLKKINYRFRLDWNYYSNSMEGNTLTMKETRSIMIGNITIQGKPIKDVLEMRGHDHAIQDIMKIGKGDLNISETRIKAMHRAIMHEEDKSKAKDIGEWKKENNYILNTKGERYDFTPHEQIPEVMHELINWYSAEKEKIETGEKDALHPALHAIEFHLRYLTIHPFYDGNGRTARMLLNLILIAHGYPPIVIRTEEKEQYYQYLTDIQGYGGDKDLYYELMLDLLLKSLTIVYDAATGKDISQPDDLDKKITLLENELKMVDPEEEVQREFNRELLLEIAEGWFSDLALKAIPAIQKFNRFFVSARHYISVQPIGSSIDFSDENAKQIVNRLIEELRQQERQIGPHDCKIYLSANYGAFKKGGLESFGCNYGLDIKFDTIKYTVETDGFSENSKRQTEVLVERLLHKPLSTAEIDEATDKLTNAIFEHIDYHTKKAGLR